MGKIYLLLLYALMGGICYYHAKRRGRNPYIWLGIGVFFGILGLITLFILPPLRRRNPQPVAGIAKINLETLDPSHSSKLWYYLDQQNQQFGPMSIDALSSAWHNGKVNRTTFVWNEVMDSWKRIEEVLRPPLKTS